MKKIKVLNLYSGIGGNRKLWKNCEVTAVELDKEIANIYQKFFPKDKVIIGDAHQYLLKHYKEFDFIWSSPPCQSHSQVRLNLAVKFNNSKPIFPDMKLYEEIIFLKHYFKRYWVVENVMPYYQLLIKAQKIQRHLFWSNFEIKDKKFIKERIGDSQIKDLEKIHGFNLSKFRLTEKRQILRNCIYPPLGLHIFNEFKKVYKTGAKNGR